MFGCSSVSADKHLEFAHGGNVSFHPGSAQRYNLLRPLRIALLLIHGTYRFRAQRLAFRNDYCLSCARPCRSVQVRTFDAWHIFWMPVVPLGFHKRWLCTICGHQPHVYPGTRRGFKWAGIVVLLMFSAAFWARPLTPDILVLGWLIRIAAPLGAILTLVHLLRTPRDASLKEKLSVIPPASDTVCPFCGSNLLALSSQCTCPTCGVLRL